MLAAKAEAGFAKRSPRLSLGQASLPRFHPVPERAWCVMKVEE